MFWFPDRNGARTQPLIYLPDSLGDSQGQNMASHLLAEAQAVDGSLPAGCGLQRFPAPEGQAPEAISPENMLTFPLNMGNVCFGLLALQLKAPREIGRDTSATLSLAANHLGLVLHNALRLEQVTEEADHDGLTGLNNRQHFDRRLQEEWQRHQRLGQPFSLLMLDLDHFKDLNDAHGHLAGDRALAAVGRLLQASLRQSDFPARYGGEEFVVILPHTDGPQARHLAERLRQALAVEPVAHRDGSALRLTASFGVAASVPGHTGTPEELLHLADQALYQAKNNGRNQVACAPCPAH
jgi:diguanylate cyclase (GGDEF)-like protein